jgi:HEPN domain-containing protein
MGRRYLRQAESDLHVANRNILPGSHYVAASLAHQAAEKALKAAHWHVRGEEAPWRHDLNAAAERIAERVGVLPGSVDAALQRLDPLFERTRYPSGSVDEPIPVDLIDETIARQSVRDAEEVLAWVRTLFRQMWP